MKKIFCLFLVVLTFIFTSCYGPYTVETVYGFDYHVMYPHTKVIVTPSVRAKRHVRSSVRFRNYQTPPRMQQPMPHPNRNNRAMPNFGGRR